MADVDMYEESVYASDDLYDEDSGSDFDDEENAVVASKPKAGVKKAASSKSVLTPSKNVDNVPKAKGKSSKEEKTIEEMYQKKTQLEHILLRPDTYSKSP